MLLHCRFFLNGGGEATFSASSEGNVQIGAFPTSFAWQRIEAAVNVPRPASRLDVYLGCKDHFIPNLTFPSLVPIR